MDRQGKQLADGFARREEGLDAMPGKLVAVDSSI